MVRTLIDVSSAELDNAACRSRESTCWRACNNGFAVKLHRLCSGDVRADIAGGALSKIARVRLPRHLQARLEHIPTS